MKILQLCNKVPFPPKDGGCKAMDNLTQGLIKEGHQVKVLAINTKKHFTNIDTLPASYRNSTNIEAIYIDTDVKASAAFLNLFSSKSYNITRFYSKDFETKLIELLKAEKYDIIQLESLYVSMYANVIKANSHAKIILRAHNIEHQLWELAAEQSSNFIKKAYLKLLAKRLKNYELNSLKSYDAIAAITSSDEQFFKQAGYQKPVKTFAFGFDLSAIENLPFQVAEPNSIFHLGAMDWLPNVEGVNWFLNEIWPLVHSQHSNLKLYLAGRSMDVEYWKQQNHPNVVITGEVDDAYSFMLSKDIMIAPLLTGAGMRVKMIEGMALGKTIVTTTKGAEGIDCKNNVNCMIADNAKDFAKAIDKCITDKQLCLTLDNNAKQLAINQYDNSNICKELTKFYFDLIAK